MKHKRVVIDSLLVNQFTAGRSIRQPCLSLRRLQTQSYTAGPERPERRFPGTDKPFRLRRWQQIFGISALVGGATFLSYKVYSDKQMRDSFTSYKLVRKDPVSSTASIFTLEPENRPEDQSRYSKAWQQGIWNVQLKQPQLQIVRPYTPLPPAQDSSSEGQLRFLIRNEIGGEVSSYLHRLPIGSQVELRGPNPEYEIPPSVKQVVFFAGGTGIAPAFQVAHALFSSEDSARDRKLHILWANRRREECVGGHSDPALAEPLALKSKLTRLLSTSQSRAPSPPVEDQGLIVRELELLKKKFPGQITVEYFVNEENSHINTAAVCKALSRLDDHDFSSPQASRSTEADERQILISGPSGFISSLAGPKEWKNGKEQQGGISKILAHALSMYPHHVKIWKI